MTSNSLVADRVKEQTATTGTGTITTTGAVTGFQSLSAAIGTGNRTPYRIESGNGSDWECGTGLVTVTGGTTTLAREVILASSNSGSAINLSGTSTVVCDAPAASLFFAGIDIVPTQTSSGFSSWYNQPASATVTNTPSGIAVSCPSQGSNNTVAAIKATVPSTPYTFVGKIMTTLSGGINGGLVLGWSDGTKVHGYMHNNSNLYVGAEWSNATTFAGQQTTISTSGGSNYPTTIITNPVYFQLEDDGTNVHFSRGFDGYNFIQDYSVAKSSGFLGASGYTNFVFGTDAFSLATLCVLMSWVRTG